MSKKNLEVAFSVEGEFIESSVTPGKEPLVERVEYSIMEAIAQNYDLTFIGIQFFEGSTIDADIFTGELEIATVVEDDDGDQVEYCNHRTVKILGTIREEPKFY